MQSNIIIFQASSGERFSYAANPDLTVKDLIDYVKTQLANPPDEIDLVYRNSTLMHEIKVESINYDYTNPNDYIFVKPHVQSPNHSKERKGGYKLTSRSDISKFPGPENDPPDFPELVASLQELGLHYTKEEYEKALRMAFYNCDRATAFLFRGSIPSEFSAEVNAEFDNRKTNLTPEQKALAQKLASDYHKSISTVIQVLTIQQYNETEARKVLASIK